MHYLTFQWIVVRVLMAADMVFIKLVGISLHIISKDLVEAVQEFFFFFAAILPRNFSTSFLVLIPKVVAPSGFDKFRTISLCSVFYKICSRILISRLSLLLPRLMSLEQGTFISGKSIFDNISLT